MSALPAYYSQTFSQNWEQQAQQTQTKLLGAVTTDSFTGKSKSYNELASTEMTEITEKKGETPDGDSTGIKYHIYRRAFEFVKRWDEHEAVNLGEVVLPTSDEMRSAVAAENRKKDDIIIAAFDATRYVGENGTDSDAFDTNYSIAANYPSATSGLTMAKVRQIARIMNEAEVPEGDRYIAYGARQLDDMLATVEATSRDYSDMMSLRDGKISYFMGFNWIQTQRLTYNSSTDIRSVFAWHKDGMKFADMGRTVHMDVLETKRHQTQLRAVALMGAVRSKQQYVVRCYCDQSP